MGSHPSVIGMDIEYSKLQLGRCWKDMGFMVLVIWPMAAHCNSADD
jgi:hypothetical protein